MMKKLFFFLMTVVCAMLYAPPINADTLYFYNENWDDVGFHGFTTPYCYFVSGTTNNSTHIQMTAVEGKIYKIDYTRSSGNLTMIFTESGKRGNGLQTVDITNNDANGKRFRINGNSNNKWTGFWESYNPGGGGGTTTSAAVHMPIKKSEWDGPRYFLVGTRMGDWRLQPEWELKGTGSTRTLSGRLMYKGMFGVAKVDTYDDYTHHRYTLYVNNKYYVKTSNSSISLPSSRSAQAIRYDAADTQNQFHESNTLIWDGDNRGWSSDLVKESAPSLLRNVTLTLSGQAPSAISFDFTNDKNAVAAVRTFSLVGANIRYEGLNTGFADGQGRNIDDITPQKRSSDSNHKGWANGWVLYDEQGMPYVDAYGDVMFCTAYDKEWLSTHLVQFYNETKKLPYSSLNTTFVPASQLGSDDDYADLYKMHPQGGTENNDPNNYSYAYIGGYNNHKTTPKLNSPMKEFSYTETMTDYGRNNWYNGSANWQCYVVKDMWLNGNFKVWSGWGGNIKRFDDVGDGNQEHAERWNYENGGHSHAANETVTGNDPSVGGTVTVYGMNRDVNDANFKIDGMTYFSRVILWYAPDKGMANSVLQLIRANYGPNIQAFYNGEGKRNTLRYEWWIDSQDTSADDYIITAYKIYRYKVVDGRDTEETLVNDVTSYGKKISERKSALNELDDRLSLPAGIYRYKIEATFSTPEGNVTKNAYSNTVPIYEVSAPVALTAAQQMDDKDRYTFNVEVNAAPVDEQINRVIDSQTGKTVKDLMMHYILVVDDATKAQLDNATSLTAGSQSYTVAGLRGSFWTKSTGSNARVGQNEWVEAGLWFHKFDIPEEGRDDAATIAMPKLVWHNVIPTSTEKGNPLYVKEYNNDYSDASFKETNDGAFAFTAYLTCNDNTTDFATWDHLNFQADEKSTHVVAPTAAHTLDKPHLQKSAFTYNYGSLPAIHHPDGGRLSNMNQYGEHQPEGPKADDPVHYDAYNESVAQITIDPLKIADEVKENWYVWYEVIVRPESDTEYNLALPQEKHRASMALTTSENLDRQNQVIMNVYDLDLSSLQTMSALDNRHNSYIDGTKASLKFDSDLQVRYFKKNDNNMTQDESLYNLDSPSSEGTFELGYAKPTVTQAQSAFSKFAAKHYYEYRDHLGNLMDKETVTLGYYAHAVVGFNIGGYMSNDLYPYIAFDAQQKIHYCPQHNGMYKEGHYSYECNKDNGCPAKNQQYSWSEYSFSGTRAANGGHPMNKGWHDSVTAIVPHLSCTDDNGQTIDYEDYVEYIDGSRAYPWEARFNWSRIAARSGYLPIHINPVMKWNDEDSFNAATSIKDADVTAKFAVVYPVINLDQADYNNQMPAAVVADRSSQARVDGTISPERDYSYIPEKLYMVALPAEKKIDFSSSQMTGVEEIIVDHPALSGDAEYYNLQGIRVTHPAKGQIYIVRQGDKSMKVLY